MTKKLLSFFLCLIMLFSATSVGFVKADAASYNLTKLAKLVKKFPDGKYWNHVGSKTNNPDGYSSKPCNHHASACKISEGGCECNFYNNAIQCAGYAYKTANELIGTSFSKWQKSTVFDVSKLCVGDIIRYYNNTHSITVVGVKGNTIAYTGANWGGNCLIRWDTMDAEEIKGFSYVLHDPDNQYKNTNLTFFKDVNGYLLGSSIPSCTELWQVSSDVSLNVRKGPSTSEAKVGSVPSGKTFYVTQKKFDGTYLWGKVEYSSIKGWCALNYAQYISGEYQKETVYDIPDTPATIPFTVKWSAVNAAEKYTVTVYNSKSEAVLRVYTTKTNALIVLSAPGKYAVSVTAANSKSDSWEVISERKQFKITDAPLPVPQEIKLEKENISLYTGEILNLNISTVPKNADRSFVFESSDSSVASVDKNGVVKALKTGKAVITCKAAEKSDVSASCEINVSLATVTSLKQTAASTGSVKLIWKKVVSADGYILYRKTSSGKWKRVGDVSENSFTEKNLSAGKDYIYIAKAYAADGSKINYSTLSAEISASTCPAKVSAVKVSGITTSSYTLSWKKNSSASYYIVYRYNDSKKAYEKYKTVTETSFKISGKAGETKKYRVAAVRKGKTFSAVGAQSDTVHGFVKPGNISLKATGKSKSVTLSWKLVKGATRYEVYIKSGDTYKKLKVLNANTKSFTATGLKSGGTYTYKVRAATKHGTTEAYGNYKKISVKAK